MDVFENILALDTALGGCGAAVVCGDRSACRSEEMPRGQAEYLVPFADQVLRDAGLDYVDLNAVLCTVGPGAFTGLRIGLSAARAFGLSLGVPVFGITTLQAMSLEAVAKGVGDHSVIIETKRRDFYAQSFNGAGGALGEPVALELEALESFLSKDAVLIGDGVGRFIEESGQDDWHVGDQNDLPDMVLAAKALQKKRDSSIFIENAEPVYLRGVDVSYPKNKPRQLERCVK